MTRDSRYRLGEYPYVFRVFWPDANRVARIARKEGLVGGKVRVAKAARLGLACRFNRD